MKNPIARKSSQSTSSSQLTFSQGVILLVIATIALFGVSGYYWYKAVLTDPERLLSDMVDKSLQTSGMYRTVTQESSQSNMSQATYTGFSPKFAAQANTKLSELSLAGQTNVETETIGTKTADYVTYKGITVNQNSDLKGLSDVIGVWGKNESKPEAGLPVSFLNEALFVAVPFGNLNADQRRQVKEVVDQTQLYKIDSTKLEYHNGRPVMQYSIKLDPQNLVRVLAKYAEVTNAIDRAQLDPAAYEGSQAVDLKFEVDVLSRHLKSIEFVSAGRTERYSGYNARHGIVLPEKTIGVDELQTRLQNVEQGVQQQQPQQQ